MTATDVVVSGGGGILHTVTVGTGGTSASISLYDGTSSSGSLIGVFAASAQASFCLDVLLRHGLYAAVTGTPDVTVVILPAPELVP